LEVAVRAVGRYRRIAVLGERTFRLDGTGIAGGLDIPTDRAEISRDVDMAGWASTQHGGVSRVEISVDGEPLGRARLRLPRLDIAAVPGHAFGPLSGFEFRGALPGSLSDTVDIAVDVFGAEGAQARLTARAVRRVPVKVTAAEGERASALRLRTDHICRVLRRREHTGGLHLLVFTHDLGIGGGQLYLNELLRHLAPLLPRCTVVSPTDGELRAELESLGIDVIVTGRALPTDIENYEGQLRELSLFILGSDATVVLLNTLGVWPAGDCAQRLGIPTIWSIHESFAIEHWMSVAYGYHDWHPYARDRLVATLGCADRLVFEAAATSEMFASHAEARRRLVVKYGVDTDAIASYAHAFGRTAARAAHGIPDDGVVLLSVGTLEERKAQACLVEAFIDVARAHPSSTLVIVGDRPSRYSEILHQLIKDADLGCRIQLLPVTPDIWHWYALSDVLVSASDIESLPRSMLEAMAFGLPSVSTEVFGVPEVIEDGRNGWLFPARDMAALPAALNRVLGLSSEERRAVGEAARETAERDHRSDAYGKAYWQMIGELARRRGRCSSRASSAAAPGVGQSGAATRRPCGPDSPESRA
jgi:glycosyltransferase involved in cell wall biosynthesis